MIIYDWDSDILPYLDTMQPVSGGYSTAKRGVVTLADGTKVFVKLAEGEVTKKWLRKEVDVYEKLNEAGYPFIPQLLSHNMSRTAMAIEYLASASFENTWDSKKLEAVMNAQHELKKHQHIFEGDLNFTLESVVGLDSKWPRVLLPGALETLNTKFGVLGVSIKLDSQQLKTYQQQLGSWVIKQDTLVHQDIRADNFGYDVETGTGKLIDWNWLCIGDVSLDSTPLFVNMYLSGFNPYRLHPEKYDVNMLIYMISFWLERILSGDDVMDQQEFERRRAQANSVKAALELLAKSGDLS